MKKVCLRDINIHSNFHQNRSLNKWDRMILAFKWSYMILYYLRGHAAFNEKFVSS